MIQRARAGQPSGKRPVPRRGRPRAAAAALAAALTAVAMAAAEATAASAAVTGTAVTSTAVTGTAPGQPAAAAPRTVLAWGDNSVGELGNGSKGDPSGVPVRVHLPAGTRIRSVSAGCGFALALTSKGQVLGWGTNRDGRLGRGGDRRARTTPVRVPVPAHAPVIAVRAGCHHALALTASGQVWGWGRNLQGQIGTGHATGAPVLSPVRVHLPSGTRVTAIGAGYDTSVAVTARGRVWTWGANGFGQLGIGTHGPRQFRAAPVLARLPAGVRGAAVATGTSTDYVVTRSGQVWAWGQDSFLELGIGRQVLGFSARPVRVRLPAGARVASLAAGCYFALARTTTGSALGWGDNNSGELATGAHEVGLPTRPTLPAGTRVTAVGASCRSSLILTGAGRILAAGLNGSGELGTGAPGAVRRHLVPVDLPGGFTATRLGSGSQAHGSYALGH
jgi:alpha-tubulin suppressor-like RCC1 family protein